MGNSLRYCRNTRNPLDPMNKLAIAKRVLEIIRALPGNKLVAPSSIYNEYLVADDGRVTDAGTDNEVEKQLLKEFQHSKYVIIQRELPDTFIDDEEDPDEINHWYVGYLLAISDKGIKTASADQMEQYWKQQRNCDNVLPGDLSKII